MTEEVDYTVHSILDMKIELEEEGFVYYYLIDWGDGVSKPNWEPSYNLSCPSKIRAFRKRQEKANTETIFMSMSPTQKAAYKEMLLTEDPIDKDIRQKFEELRRTSPYPIAFDRNLNVRRIINAFEHRGKLIYVVAWKNCNKVDAIPAKLCNVMIPKHVINFFESKLWIRNHKGMLLRWRDDEDEEYNSPWSKTAKICGEINKKDYERVSFMQPEVTEDIEIKQNNRKMRKTKQ